MWVCVIGVSCLIPLSLSYAQCIAGLPCVADHSTGANDSKAESAACDADFMNQIYARAFIESDREVAVAQQYVTKPNSVLEFSCFDTVAKEFLETYNPVFSADTSSPGAVPEGRSYSNFIKLSVQSHLSTSYGHDYVSSGTGEAYSDELSPCDSLMSAQFLSRCANFDTLGEGFYSFDTLTNVDPRVGPYGVSCPGTAVTEDLLKVATNDEFKYAAFDIFEEYPEQVTEPACSDPVGTGLFYEAPSEISWTTLGEYIFGSSQAYEHKVCVNPLCTYVVGEDSCQAK